MVRLPTDRDYDDDPILMMKANIEPHKGSTENWPDAHFFGNGLLSMIFKCREDPDLPRMYQLVAQNLGILVNEALPSIVRSRAVLAVADWLGQYEHDTDRVKWIETAADLGHPNAVHEVIINRLNDAGYKIIDSSDTNSLPPSIQVTEARVGWRSICSFDVLVSHLTELPSIMEEGANDWTADEFQASIKNIILFFAFGIKLLGNTRDPSFRFGKVSSSYRSTAVGQEDDWAERASALQDHLFWLDEVWVWLIDEYVNRNEGHLSLEKQRQTQLAQRRVMKLFLKNLHAMECEDELIIEYSELVEWKRLKQEKAEVKELLAVASEDQVILLQGEIPPASEKWDVQYLKRFECLKEPLPLTPLPSLARIEEITSQLTCEFPWAAKACHQVTQELLARAANGSRSLGFSPILLVGPPGSGKTRFAQRLGALLEIPNSVINCAGMSDTKTFKGLTRGWASARPSLMIERIVQTRRACHLFVLDEVDKMDRRYEGAPFSALLDLLEPQNAARYSDGYLLAEVDLSHCLFAGTANSLEVIPAPLLDRLQPVFVPQPGPEHASTLIRGIVADLEASWGLPQGTIDLDTNQKQVLAGLPARQLRRGMVQLLANQAKQRSGGMLAQ